MSAHPQEREYSPNEEAVGRRLRMLHIFTKDILDNPELAELLPDTPEYLDMWEPGARSDRSPDFSTPNVDVFVVPHDQLKPHQLIGLDREI